MTITKPNPDWKTIEKDLKAIRQLFGVCSEDVRFNFYGNAVDAKTKEAIFGARGIECKAWKYTERQGCTLGVMWLADDLDGEGDCWIIPDENYDFSVSYIFNI